MSGGLTEPAAESGELSSGERPSPAGAYGRRSLWRTAILLAAVWILVTALEVAFPFGFFLTVSVCVLAALLASPVVAVIGCLVILCGGSKRTLIVAGTVFAFTLSSFFAGATANRWQTRCTQQRAVEIIEAVEQYEAEHGVYPAELAAIVPDYLPAIPRTCMGLTGRTFFYERCEDSTFRLEFDVHDITVASYRSHIGAWLFYD